MTIPTKEQIEKVTVLACLKQKEISDCSECILASTGECDLDWLPYFTKEIINEWEKIRNIKRLRLEVGKTYIAKDGSEVKIIYKSPVRCTGFLGIRATDGKTHPDDAIWYNPDGSHNEKYDGLTIISPK